MTLSKARGANRSAPRRALARAPACHPRRPRRPTDGLCELRGTLMPEYGGSPPICDDRRCGSRQRHMFPHRTSAPDPPPSAVGNEFNYARGSSPLPSTAERRTCAEMKSGRPGVLPKKNGGPGRPTPAEGVNPHRSAKHCTKQVTNATNRGSGGTAYAPTNASASLLGWRSFRGHLGRAGAPNMRYRATRPVRAKHPQLPERRTPLRSHRRHHRGIAPPIVQSNRNGSFRSFEASLFNGSGRATPSRLLAVREHAGSR